MKRILLITTGGTISCRDSGEGLTPALRPAELLFAAPDAAAFAAALWGLAQEKAGADFAACFSNVIRDADL